MPLTVVQIENLQKYPRTDREKRMEGYKFILQRSEAQKEDGRAEKRNKFLAFAAHSPHKLEV